MQIVVVSIDLFKCTQHTTHNNTHTLTNRCIIASCMHALAKTLMQTRFNVETICMSMSIEIRRFFLFTHCLHCHTKSLQMCVFESFKPLKKKRNPETNVATWNITFGCVLSGAGRTAYLWIQCAYLILITFVPLAIYIYICICRLKRKWILFIFGWRIYVQSIYVHLRTSYTSKRPIQWWHVIYSISVYSIFEINLLHESYFELIQSIESSLDALNSGQMQFWSDDYFVQFKVRRFDLLQFSE